MTKQRKLDLIAAYLAEFTDPEWREMMIEYRSLLERKPDSAETLGAHASREDILKEAITCTCTDRNLQYGGPESSFSAIAELWTGYFRASGHDITLTTKDAALMLMLFKTARAITSETPKADTYIDMAGYVACAGETACGGGHHG